jgi:hypothetical protein
MTRPTISYLRARPAALDTIRSISERPRPLTSTDDRSMIW